MPQRATSTTFVQANPATHADTHGTQRSTTSGDLMLEMKEW